MKQTHAPTIREDFATLLPLLSTEEFEALKASIKAEGVLVPIFVDEDGTVLDGHNRLKIDPRAPTQQVPGSGQWTDAEKKAFVIRSNINRRNLSPTQKKEVQKTARAIAWDLRTLKTEQGRPRYTQGQVATLLGVARQTVADWFRPNAGSGNGSETADSRVKIPVDQHAEILRRYEAKKTQEQIAADYGVAQKHISRIIKKEQARAERIAAAVSAAKTVRLDPHRADVRRCTMAELLTSVSGVDAIITDPPYGKKWLSVYEELAQLAPKALKKDGLLAVLCGQAYLPEILAAMTPHVAYCWTMAYLTPGGQSASLWWLEKSNTFWKPVVLFGPPVEGVWRRSEIGGER